jgi:hypothetical protein
MSALTRAGTLALVFTLIALVLHPGLGSQTWLGRRTLVLAVLVATAALALAARVPRVLSSGRVGDLLVVAGGLALVAAVATDGLKGHSGVLALRTGQASSSFDERGPEGEPLGLRPLGFTVEAASIGKGGGAALVFGGEALPRELRPGRALRFGGYRFGRPRVASTGGAARLRIGIADGEREEQIDIEPGQPARKGDLEIALEQYFPDFALDQGKPFSRSNEPRNPAALLSVTRGEKAFRVFVIRSMPGIHRVEGLSRAFSLLSVEPERQVELDVHSEPGALLALVAGLLVALGLAVSLAGRARHERAPAPLGPAGRGLLTGAALVAFLLFANRGGVLSWTFELPTSHGRAVLPGVGVLLGLSLVASLGGVLLLAAQRVAGPGTDVLRPARLLLGVGAALSLMGGVVAAAEVAHLPAADLQSAGLPVAGLVVGAGLVAGALRAAPAAGRGRTICALVVPLAVLLAVLGTVAAGVLGVRGEGTYATAAVSALAATALVGLASLEPSRLAAGCRFAFLVSLLTLTLR